jgi:hypothetical protein
MVEILPFPLRQGIWVLGASLAALAGQQGVGSFAFRADFVVFYAFDVFSSLLLCVDLRRFS